MPRLPKPGSDNNTWGDILNEYLRISHDSDGTLRSEAVLNSISDGCITNTKLARDSVSSSRLASSSVTLSKLSATNSPGAGQVLTTNGINMSWQTVASGVTDHTLLSNIGTATHAQIDSHISDMNTHVAASTGVHGISDTGDLVVTNDLRSTDAVIRWDGVGSQPLRSTVTSDLARRVRWVQPSAPSQAAGYAITGDVWEQTP